MASSGSFSPPQSPNKRKKRNKSLSDIFGLPINSNLEKKFFKNLKDSTEEDQLHNLSKIEHIPIKYKCLLSLGLNFVIPQKLTKRKLDESLTAACGKIAWKLFFKKEGGTEFEDLEELLKWYIMFRSEFRKRNPTASTSECPDQDKLFIYDELLSELYKKLAFDSSGMQKLPPETMLIELSEQFGQYCKENGIMVVEADKNAGICLVRVEDYDKEALRLLTHKSGTYIPTTKSHFDFAMREFKDKLNTFQKSLFSKKELTALVNDKTENRPAKFKIYPKMHKYDPISKAFPPGRPISSTYNKTNKIAASLLQHILRPCTVDIKDLLLDTQHLIILLDNLKLDKDKKYCLVTMDIESLYPTLNLADCKKHCSRIFEACTNPDKLDLETKDLESLFDLSFNYNFVTFKDEWYKQVKGIEMGNSASNIVANITVFRELDHLFRHEIIAFYKRFMDDIFLILEFKDGLDVDKWLKDNIKHEYLTFTNKNSLKSIDFLDITIKLTEPGNHITVELFKKPMSLQMPLHGSSNHPPHLMRSLFYSQGLRVVRTCSDGFKRSDQLYKLKAQFELRDHKQFYLEDVLEKLLWMDRKTALIPKKQLLCNYLHVNEEAIYMALKLHETSIEKEAQPDYINIVFPFHKQIANYSKTVEECIVEHIHKNCEESEIDDVTIRVVYSRLPNIKDLLNKQEQSGKLE